MNSLTGLQGPLKFVAVWFPWQGCRDLSSLLRIMSFWRGCSSFQFVGKHDSTDVVIGTSRSLLGRRIPRDISVRISLFLWGMGFLRQGRYPCILTVTGTISQDGNSFCEFYKKPAGKPLLVHYQSTMPTKSKLNFIRNALKTDAPQIHPQNNTWAHLRLNGYPEKSIEQTKRSQNLQRNSQPAGTEWSCLKIPYISERLNHRITNIF